MLHMKVPMVYTPAPYSRGWEFFPRTNASTRRVYILHEKKSALARQKAPLEGLHCKHYQQFPFIIKVKWSKWIWKVIICLGTLSIENALENKLAFIGLIFPTYSVHVNPISIKRFFFTSNTDYIEHLKKGNLENNLRYITRKIGTPFKGIPNYIRN